MVKRLSSALPSTPDEFAIDLEQGDLEAVWIALRDARPIGIDMGRETEVFFVTRLDPGYGGEHPTATIVPCYGVAAEEIDDEMVLVLHAD